MNNPADGPPLRIEHLSKRSGRGRGRVTALNDVSLEFAAGSFTAVLGASGSGKSTPLQCAAGLDRPSSGRALLCGTDPASVSDRKRTLLRRRRVGFVFQDLSLLPELTVAENIALPLRLDHRRVTRAAIEDAAARVGLSPAQVRRLPAELSGGQQQRAAVARVLPLGRGGDDQRGCSRRVSRPARPLVTTRRAPRVCLALPQNGRQS
jgi:putative ABC transport system ATP-binding protein